MVLTILITLSGGIRQSITTQLWACTTPKVCLMFYYDHTSYFSHCFCMVIQFKHFAPVMHFWPPICSRLLVAPEWRRSITPQQSGTKDTHRGGSRRPPIRRRKNMPAVIYQNCITCWFSVRSGCTLRGLQVAVVQATWEPWCVFLFFPGNGHLRACSCMFFVSNVRFCVSVGHLHRFV